MKPTFLLSVILSSVFTLFVVAPSASANAAGADDVSPGGRCLLEGSSCRGDSDCCTQSCENGSCVTRDP
jgi:hypothetical protein